MEAAANEVLFEPKVLPATVCYTNIDSVVLKGRSASALGSRSVSGNDPLFDSAQSWPRLQRSIPWLSCWRSSVKGAIQRRYDSSDTPAMSFC
jgi:hypothetical protein